MKTLNHLKLFKNIAYNLKRGIVSPNDVVANFHSDHYLRHNARRLEHLASLGIPVAGKSVLEIGAGIGDHSSYYIDRECRVTITDVRPENIRYLTKRYPHENIQFLDMENPVSIVGQPFDIVHCYGLLYHLSNPEIALKFISSCTKKILLLETCVSFGVSEDVNLLNEPKDCPTQAHSGTGCRPTRSWIFKQLQDLFGHVYIPLTQPNHEEFPLDWKNSAAHKVNNSRAIFIASRDKLENSLLTTSLLDLQTRHN